MRVVPSATTYGLWEGERTNSSQVIPANLPLPPFDEASSPRPSSIDLKPFAFVAFAVFALGGGHRPSAATNAAPPDALALRRFEWIAPFPTPRVIAAKFPRENPVVSVEKLLVANSQVWAALRPRRATNLPSGWGRLWSYSDQQGSLEPVRGALEMHSVNAMAADARRLWLALDGGLASLDFSSHIVDAYGPAQGFASTNLAGVGLVEGTVVAMGRFGMIWGLLPGTTNFIRANNAAPTENPRLPSPWSWFATSGDWLAGVAPTGVAVRNWRSQEWISMRDEFANGSPSLDPPVFNCVTGDGEGGFWLGSNLGLHWINPASSVVENRFITLPITVPGGLGLAVAQGFQPTAAAYEIARQRVMNGVRERMSDRARYARANVNRKEPIDPAWPTSRIPGGVTALCRDGPMLWVATKDGANVSRARVLLMHQATRRWVGWFSVGAPVLTMAADAKRLWLGLDSSRSPGLSPLLVVDRPPLLAVPQTQWTKDTISAEELGTKLANLPVKERAVLAFFDHDPEKVVELLAPDGEASDDADAETLFLLAFAYDLIGLNQPDRLDHFIGLLRERHPDSLFAELVGNVRSARAAPALDLDEGSKKEAEIVAPTPPPESDSTPAPSVSETVPNDNKSARAEAVLAKRDLNRDGQLNVIEFRLWLGSKADFPKADTSKDGQVDAAEILQLLSEIDGATGIPDPTLAK
ncbi:MAG TPA: hypothetical protein DCE44_26150 [Verrucomicrobiales bacterium]|nr:hypothetical protein [Verrucomicrobiales bacterium]